MKPHARIPLLAAGAIAVAGILVLSRFAQWGARPVTLGEPVELPPGFMTYEEYGKVEHGRPYPLEVGGGPGRLLYFGIGHTRDPADPQLAEMRRRWEGFRPTVALCEGHLPFFVGTREGAFREFGESAVVYDLAGESGIEIHSLEPTREEEAAHLLEQFPAERVALFLTLRRYVSLRRGEGPEGVEKRVRGMLGRVKGLPGLGETFPDLEAMARFHAREFPDRPDWREVPEAFFDPGRTDTWMNEVHTRSNRFRDAHMVALLVRLVRRGERVFATVGASHVVMAEPALRAALGG